LSGVLFSSSRGLRSIGRTSMSPASIFIFQPQASVRASGVIC
jgi:hypothetical protein